MSITDLSFVCAHCSRVRSSRYWQSCKSSPFPMYTPGAPGLILSSPLPTLLVLRSYLPFPTYTPGASVLSSFPHIHSRCFGLIFDVKLILDSSKIRLFIFLCHLDVWNRLYLLCKYQNYFTTIYLPILENLTCCPDGMISMSLIIMFSNFDKFQHLIPINTITGKVI